MTTYSDHAQRELDQRSGLEMDKSAALRNLLVTIARAEAELMNLADGPVANLAGAAMTHMGRIIEAKRQYSAHHANQPTATKLLAEMLEPKP